MGMMYSQIFIRLAIWLSVVAVATASTQCILDVRDAKMIDINYSEKYGAVVLANVVSQTQEECQSACCNSEEETFKDGTSARCNLAVYHRTRGQRNSKKCYLIFCPSEDACRLQTISQFSSTFVTQKTTQSSTQLEEKELASLITTKTETLTKKTTQSQSPAESTPSLPTSASQSIPSIPAGRSESPKVLSSTLEPLQMNQTNQTKAVNETAASVDTSDSDQAAASNNIISSNGALIAAVCFGVLFLLAVLVVLSKHWYEAYQRRHYSKVDYLINGMYK